MNNNMPLAYAPIYAHMGIPILVLVSQAKLPVSEMKGWQDGGIATTDLAVIQKWQLAYPGANFGLAAFSVPGGFCFLEFDQGSLTELCQKYGHELPTTRVHVSGGGGKHFLFRHTVNSIALGNRSAKRDEHEWFSFRADRKYIVGAGSIHPNGARYSVHPKYNIEPSPIPDWLVAAIEKESRGHKVQSPATGERKKVSEDFDFDEFLDHYEIGIQGVKDKFWHIVDECPGVGYRHEQSTETGFYFDGETLGFNCFAGGCPLHELSIGEVIRFLNEQTGDPYRGVIWNELDDFGDGFKFDEDEAAKIKRLADYINDTTDLPGDASEEKFCAKIEVESTEMYPLEGVTIGRNDAYNAHRLVEMCGHDILFVYEAGGKSGGWYVWDGRRWVFDAANVQMTKKAKSVVASLFMEAAKNGGDEGVALAKWATISLNQNKIDAMIKSAKSEARAVHLSDFNPDLMLFNTMNGTIDLRTGRVKQYDRRDLITMISPVFFDPEVSCPRFEQFLAEIFPEDTKDISAFIQRAAGYSVSGEIREECFFVGYGAGRNGKGKFVDALMQSLGEYAKPAPFDIFVAKKSDEGKPNDIADLFGARFVAASEGDQSKRLNEAKLKALVSGDMVTGEKKYQDAFHFRPNYKIWLFSNYKPRIVGTDEGIWDKIFMVGFDRYFAPDQRDRHLLEKLKAEAAGILNWLIKGCLEWQRVGLAAPDCIRQRTQEYRAEQDVLSHFVEDELETEAGTTASKSETYSRYSAWAERMGEFVMTASEFTERMGRLFQEKRISRGKVWMGFRLKSYRDSNLSEIENRWSGEESMQNIPDVLPGQPYAVLPTYD